MTDGERLQKFDADFEKLKKNREKVPLEQLRTRYADAYNALVAEVQAGRIGLQTPILTFWSAISPGTPGTPPGMSGWTRGSPPYGNRRPNPADGLSGTGPHFWSGWTWRNTGRSCGRFTTALRLRLSTHTGSGTTDGWGSRGGVGFTTT